MAPKKKVENPSSPEKTPRKRTTKIKYTIQQDDFRTTIPPNHLHKLKANDSQEDKEIVRRSVSQLVDDVKKAKQDTGKNKTNLRGSSKNLAQTDKSILHKLKDAIYSFFSSFKK